MGFRHNNVLHNNHFHKDWQRRVKTWFNQPGRKLRHRRVRKDKAAALGVRPLQLLRPVVRGQTVRYNTKLRQGRGFSLLELKEAGISRKVARGLGIVVDHRRRNLSEEGKNLNIERLKAYKERLIVFPRKKSKPGKGDTTGDELNAKTTRTLPFSIPTSSEREAPRAITEEERQINAAQALNTLRHRARNQGRIALRAKREAEEAANKK